MWYRRDFMCKLPLSYSKLPQNVKCGVKVIILHVNMLLNQMYVLVTASCGIKWHFFICFQFLCVAYINRFPVDVTRTKNGLSGPHRLMSSPESIHMNRCVPFCMHQFMFVFI